MDRDARRAAVFLRRRRHHRAGGTAEGHDRDLDAGLRASRREREVTRLALRGLAAAEIAAALSISGHTARDHLKAIYTKTGAGGRGRLAALLAPWDDRDL
jgi:DNA-binding CsgD family transcriptional regulator